MAYGKVREAFEFHGNIALKIEFYLEPADLRYSDTYVQVVDTKSAEFLAGYPGKLNPNGTPKNQAAYDAWMVTLPKVWQLNPFHTHFVYFDPDFTEAEVKAEIDYHLPNFYRAFQDAWDTVPGGMRHGFAVEKRIAPVRYEELDKPEIFVLRKAQCLEKIATLQSITSSPTRIDGGKTFPATTIDVGPGATSRATGTSQTQTSIDLTNSANATGTLDTFEVWIYGDAATGVKMGTFSGSGTDYDDRDYFTWGNVASGSKQTSTGQSVDVSTGDYLGIYLGTSYVMVDTSGGSGRYSVAGDKFGSGSATYTLNANQVISIYATGATPNIAYKDAPTRFKVTARGYKDALARFKITVQTYKDAPGRFLATVRNYKDAAGRFWSTATNYKDASGRFLVELQIFYKDVSTRFWSTATNFKDAASRFLITVRNYKDAATRFRITVRNYKDAATRFRSTATNYKDASARFFNAIQNYKDAAARFYITVRSYKDAATRFRITIRNYKDAASRFLITVRNFKDAAARFKVTARSFKDAACRFLVTPLVIPAPHRGFQIELRTPVVNIPHGYESPNGYVDDSSVWANEANAYDKNIATAATAPSQGYLQLTFSSPMSCSKIKAFCANWYWEPVSGNTAWLDSPIEVDLFVGGAWVNVWAATITKSIWVEKTFAAVTATKARIRSTNAGYYAPPPAYWLYLYLYEIMFYREPVASSGGALIAILENAFDATVEYATNEAPIINFSLPVDDAKAASIIRANDIWVRDMATGLVIAAGRMNLKEDSR
jgi:hypothetical protein